MAPTQRQTRLRGRVTFSNIRGIYQSNNRQVNLRMIGSDGLEREHNFQVNAGFVDLKRGDDIDLIWEGDTFHGFENRRTGILYTSGCLLLPIVAIVSIVAVLIAAFAAP